MNLPELRIGLGTDLHLFDATRPLVLGGVKIPDEPGLLGHSDGDALLHALADACLGAAGLADIGQLFPPDAPECKGLDSRKIATKTISLLAKDGWSIVNLDVVLEGKRPQISPLKEKLRQGVADAFGITPERVNLKGKTNEGLGELGAGKALYVVAVALLSRS